MHHPPEIPRVKLHLQHQRHMDIGHWEELRAGWDASAVFVAASKMLGLETRVQNKTGEISKQRNLQWNRNGDMKMTHVLYRRKCIIQWCAFHSYLSSWGCAWKYFPFEATTHMTGMPQETSFARSMSFPCIFNELYAAVCTLAALSRSSNTPRQREAS